MSPEAIRKRGSSSTSANSRVGVDNQRIYASTAIENIAEIKRIAVSNPSIAIGTYKGVITKPPNEVVRMSSKHE